MENPVGLRLRPTEEELFDDYLRPKNLKSNTSHVDRVISTVFICSFDPWELPPQSRSKLKDHVWYFFSPKKNKHGKGERQTRTTKSGYWKITGKPKDIIRTSGNRQKIGHKRVLMFYFGKTPNGSKSDWVMHEYHLLSPTQMMTYTICKVKFKGNKSEIEQSRSLIPPMNNIGELSSGTEGLLTSQELQNQQPQFTNFPDVEELDWLFANITSDRFKGLLDDDEQSKIVTMDEARSNHIPKKALTGVFSGYSSDDSDSGFHLSICNNYFHSNFEHL